MSVSVAIYAPVTSPLAGELVASVSPDQLTQCRYATTITGGFAGANIGVRPGVLMAGSLPYFAHVVTLVDDQPVYEGVLTEPARVGGSYTTLPLDGYYFSALDDHTYASDAAGTVSGGVLAQSVIQEAAPRLALGTGDQWADPGGAYVPADYDAKLPSVILNAIAKAATAGTTAVDFRVWDNRVLWSVPRLAPDTPDYLVAAFDEGLSRRESAKATYGALSVLYTAHTAGSASITAGNTAVTINHELGSTPLLNEVHVTFSSMGGAQHAVIQNLTPSTFDVVLDTVATGTATFGWEVTRQDVTTPRVSHPTYTDRMGMSRNIQITGGTMTNAEALAFRDAELARRAYPTVSTSIKRTGGMGLVTPNSDHIPPHLVRAGGWVWVEGDDAFLPIVSTDFDALGRVLTVTCGAAMPGLVETLRQLRDADAAARAGVLTLTGATR
jgi:hypothetical protein